ncbi:hypothetical protein GV819_04575 [Pseudomonas sp. Fl5BN2]|uniref:hypothetical protein n=1 Tax=unclassified Pseudomonas TaxID=196821 RepID=UPI00137858AF|nr:MULTISPECIES: hypothetical protein [unclassified Pseudomonas]NBF01560.1 hypothetical protein [Pseudomonas sp. Fl5BN2]NBF07072.1 hypothetical protein [Pseudomonas sp. Fl4BN1]
MTDARQTPSPEEQLLAHVREHSRVEPPAHLDALILATARREAPAPRPGLWQRWLLACQRPRYQLAFASLFGVALVIGVLQHSPEQYPQQAFSPAPGKPMARQAPPRSAELAGALSAPAPVAPAAPAAGFAMAPPMDMLSDQAPSEAIKFRAETSRLAKRVSAKASVTENLDEQLEEVLRLWQQDKTQEADELLVRLHQTYPQEDLGKRLEAMRRP